MDETLPTGPIGSRVLYEDDRVRIWDMTLEPGEDSGRHQHDNPYVIVMVDGDRIGIHEHITHAGAPGGFREAPVEIGRAITLPAGGTETAVNVGTTRYRDIQIEFL